MAAYLLDWLVTFILTCVFLSAGGLLVLATSDMGRQDPPDRVLIAALGTSALVIPVWFAITIAGWTWRGRSVGKLAMNLRVVDRLGEPPGLVRSLLRLAVYVFENAPVAALAPLAVAAWFVRGRPLLTPALTGYGIVLLVPVVSVVMALRDGSHRALHDRIAGTRVVAE